MIIYEGSSIQPRYVLASSWADPLVLAGVYRFPANWKKLPELFPASATWTSDVTPVGDQLSWHPPAPFADEILPKGNVILLRRSADGKLIRVTGTISIKSKELSLKPLETPLLPSYEHQPVVYHELLDR